MRACTAPLRGNAGLAGVLNRGTLLRVVIRANAPEQVFAQCLFVFELARHDKRVVGINLVVPEDDPMSLRDYTLHMRMLQYLSTLYPEVKIALHAGELTLGLVPQQRVLVE